MMAVPILIVLATVDLVRFVVTGSPWNLAFFILYLRFAWLVWEVECEWRRELWELECEWQQRIWKLENAVTDMAELVKRSEV